MALVALVMTALVGAGYVGRGLVDTDTVTSSGRPSGSSGSGSPGAVVSTPSGPSTPLLPGTADEPVKAVAQALGPSVVVIKNDEGLGSGVIYDSAGLILTNAHVVGTFKQVTVTLNDGHSLNGTVLGADTVTDIAVVKVSPSSPLAAARLAATLPEVGDLTVALGSPFGLDQTITSGVVSAVNRPVSDSAGGVTDMIQTDAAINPGNSGGALANRRAEVIGINSMIYSESGQNAGIGFAIPIDKAKTVADRIVNGGNLAKAYLGVNGVPTTNGDPGARVATVESGSAADSAGLKVGDVVTKVGNVAVKDSTDLAGAVAAHSSGDQVTITVQRDGASVELDATLGSAPAASTTTPNSRGRSAPTTRPGG